MTPCTVGEVYRWIDAFAPFETAMPGDNVGLLVGRMDRPVTTILTALDATPGVAEEARALGAELIVAHHPLLFAPRNRLDESDPEAALLCNMIRAGLSFIAAHTNLDIAPGGVNDALARQLSWPVSEAKGFLRLGAFPSPLRLADLQKQAEQALQSPVLRYGNPNALALRFAICSGSGGSDVANAAALGAQVLLTGEIKHSQALDAMARGLAVLAAGHRATEICAADALFKHLQSSADAVQCKVRILVSEIDPFS